MLGNNSRWDPGEEALSSAGGKYCWRGGVVLLMVGLLSIACSAEAPAGL